MGNKELVLEQEDIAMIQKVLGSGDPSHFLQIPRIRYQLAYMRARRFAQGETRVLSDLDPAIIPNTVEHNLSQIDRGAALGRCDLLINILKSIENITERANQIRILCVGPRTEAEIFGLLSLGINVNQISALDLISYSPLVDVGDMHKMPYADNSFDVVILGWVIGYSEDNAKVAREVMRVSRPGAIVAIGCEYEFRTPEQIRATGVVLDGESPRYYTTDDFLKYYDGNIHHVYFRHEVPTRKVGKNVANIMTVFELKSEGENGRA